MITENAYSVYIRTKDLTNKEKIRAKSSVLHSFITAPPPKLMVHLVCQGPKMKE